MLDAYSSAVAEWTHLLWLERVEDYSSIHGGGLQALPDWVGEPHLHCANPAGLKNKLEKKVNNIQDRKLVIFFIVFKFYIPFPFPCLLLYNGNNSIVVNMMPSDCINFYQLWLDVNMSRLVWNCQFWANGRPARLFYPARLFGTLE